MTEREESQERKTSRWLRFDLLIAFFAVLISAVTATVTIYQTHVIANQLSASVWPYLSFSSSVSNNRFLFTIENDGLGPAIVKTAVFTLDGRPLKHSSDLFDRLDRAGQLGKSIAHGSYTIYYTGISSGEVIRPSQTAGFFDVRGAALVQLLTKNATRLSLRLCYCSLLNQCWYATATPNGGGPQSTPACPPPGADELLQPEAKAPA